MELFNEQDAAIIKNMMVSRDAKYIASLLDADKDRVEEFMLLVTANTGVVSLQQKKNEKAQARRREKPTGVKAERPVMSKDDFNNIKQVKSQAIKLKNKRESEEKKEARRQKQIARVNEQEALRVKREKSRGPLYQTKQVDYTQKRMVKVDSKTWIYVDPGQDQKKAVEKVLTDYKKSLSKNEELLTPKEVKLKTCRRCKKDKPLKEFKHSSANTARRSGVCDSCLEEIEEIAKRQKN